MLFLAVALAGVGTIGTQVLIYGFVSNYYPTTAARPGVAWCAGFGRLGGIVGPIIGGVLVGAGMGGSTAFQLFAGISLLGAMVTLLVPRPAHTEAPVVGAGPSVVRSTVARDRRHPRPRWSPATPSSPTCGSACCRSASSARPWSW